MISALLLRLDAPLMSFGGVSVDQINPVERFPGRSLITGLLGNALEWSHGDREQLESLQSRLRVAARWDAAPTRIVDYHTVDLGQDFLVDTGWTTRGSREDRGGGDAKSTTHQRYRHYWANGCATVAISLKNGGGPTIEQLESALRSPARPLFIGRKTCLPSVPLLLGLRQAKDLRAALANEPLAQRSPHQPPARIEACWPAEEGLGSELREIYDRRDWYNNLHSGSELYAIGFLEVNS